MNKKVIKIIAIIIAILLVTGNIYSYIELTKRNQIIDDLEDEISEQKIKAKKNKNEIKELEYQLDYYETMYGNNKTYDETTDSHKITFSEYQEKINNKETFILVISQALCSHCQEYLPKFYDIVNTYNLPGYEIDLLTLSEDEYENILEITQSSGTPTTIFYKDGIEIPDSRIIGSKDNNTLKDAFKKYGFIK